MFGYASPFGKFASRGPLDSSHPLLCHLSQPWDGCVLAYPPLDFLAPAGHFAPAPHSPRSTVPHASRDSLTPLMALFTGCLIGCVRFVLWFGAVLFSLFFGLVER